MREKKEEQREGESVNMSMERVKMEQRSESREERVGIEEGD